MTTLENLVLVIMVALLLAAVLFVAMLSLKKITKYLTLEEIEHEKRREEISRRRKAMG